MVQTRDLLVQSPERLDQHLEDRAGDLWDWFCGILNSLHKLRNASWSFGRHDAELGQMTAEGIADLGPLLHEKIARSEHESSCLCLFALGSHKAHGRALGCFTD